MKGEILYGVHPITAALSVRKSEFYRLHIKESVLNSQNEKIKSLLDEAKRLGVEVVVQEEYVPNHLSAGRPHQVWSALISFSFFSFWVCFQFYCTGIYEYLISPLVSLHGRECFEANNLQQVCNSRLDIGIESTQSINKLQTTQLMLTYTIQYKNEYYYSGIKPILHC